jgi:hypothetical protein
MVKVEKSIVATVHLLAVSFNTENIVSLNNNIQLSTLEKQSATALRLTGHTWRLVFPGSNPHS